MVVDTSAVIAILFEPDGVPYRVALHRAGAAAMSAVNAYETRVALSGTTAGRPRFPANAVASFEALAASARISVVPFDPDQAILAHRAYLRYGRGSHPAGLNLADCAAYALARLRGEPLLYKGNDFPQTDVTPAL
jgi:ribonuclease VapC